MTDLKLLFLTRKGEGYVGAPQTRHEFEQEISKHCECVFAGQGWPLHVPQETIDVTIERVMPDCDWVIDRDDSLHIPKPNKRKRRYKIGLFISDLHGKWSYGLKNPPQLTEFINKAGYDAIFMRYKLIYGTHYRPDVVWDRLKPEVFYIPWSVDQKQFKPSRIKRIDVATIGSNYDCYPLRKSINEGIYFVCRGKKLLVRSAPRGKTFERDILKLKDTHLVGEDYVKALGDTRIFITGCSIYRYPLQKFFQTTASECMLLCNEPSTAKELGFINDKTYFSIEEDTWEISLKYFLDNPSEVKRIARAGRKNTLLNHTHQKRALELIEFLN